MTEPVNDQQPRSGLRNPGAAVRGAGAGSLAGEAIVLLLAIQPVRVLGDGLTGGGVWVIVALAVACLAPGRAAPPRLGVVRRGGPAGGPVRLRFPGAPLAGGARRDLRPALGVRVERAPQGAGATAGGVSHGPFMELVKVVDPLAPLGEGDARARPGRGTWRRAVRCRPHGW